ncbi:kinase-like domain-containing protein [Fennellomyces sp. T-0311]|nr:kinase-like domain-containing protein [Fennellomyces sp. T-0311]
MPLRHVTDQLRTKWRRSSKMDMSLPPTPSTPQAAGNNTETPDTPKHDPSSGQKHKKTTVIAPPNPDLMLQGIGEYLFVEPLGHGKFSKVMLAEHYITGEKYAVKIIDKRIHDYRILSRLVREIALMEALDHENIVHLYETFETADSLYLVMEYVPGVNLDEYLQQQPNKALSEDEARSIFRQLVAAVDYCHYRWVVHRDLKAPNILLKPGGQVKLADFGLGNRFGLQRLKTICGSMLYYSPEIITGQKYVGPEIDCWCLGILLYRITAGHEPFGHARTVGELKKDVVSGNYPMPCHLSDDLKSTIRKCLSLDRRRRLAVRQALQDDPWLNDHGKLDDPFSKSTQNVDEAIRLRTDRESSRRQHLRDMDEEKRKGYRIRKTVIYHPINASTYFTGSITHSANVDENMDMVELMRADLFQEIRVILEQVRLRPIHHMSMTDLRTPFLHIFRKFKLPEHARIRKTTSTLNFSQLYKRVTKDQINYYTIECNVRAISSTTAVSGYSTTSLSTNSLNNNDSTPALPPVPPPFPSVHDTLSPQQQDEYELILLIQSACELLGISYKHESKSQLQCVLTLRNYAPEQRSKGSPPKQHHGASRDNSEVASGASTPGRQRRRKSQLSQEDSGSSDFSDHSWASRWNRGLKRLSLPMLYNHFHHTNLNQHQKIWSNSIQVSSSAAPGSLASTGGASSKHHHPRQPPQPQPSQLDNDLSTDDGMAVFMVEAFAVLPHHTKPNKRDSQQLQRIVGLRFSSVKGSSKVFKLATGWIGGVLNSNATSKAFATSTNDLSK